MIYMTKRCPAQASNSEQEGRRYCYNGWRADHSRKLGRRSDRIPEQKLKTEREKMKSEGSKANKKKKMYEVGRSGPAENGHFGLGGGLRWDLEGASSAVLFPHGRIVLVPFLPTAPGLH